MYQSHRLLANVSFNVFTKFLHLPMKLFTKFYFAICICTLTKQKLSIFSSLYLLHFKFILVLEFFDSTVF